MNNADEKNKKDKSTHSVLDFLIRMTQYKKPPVCKGEHDWALVDGIGYDYKSDYYLCKKCELKIPRREFEL